MKDRKQTPETAPEGAEALEDYLREHGSVLYWNRGGSMRPLIRQDRDHFLIEAAGEGRRKLNDVVLYKRTNGKLVLHRIRRVREHDYGLRGDNTYVMEYGITDAQILGVMTALSRDGGPMRPVSSLPYRLYVGLWNAIYPLRYLYVKARRVGWRVKRLLRGNPHKKQDT